MTYYAFSALFNFLTSSILGGFVLFKNGRNRTHRAFVTFAATVALWSLAYYFWQVAADAPSALFWCRALMAGAIFIPVTYLHFVLRLLNIPNRKGFLIASYSLFGGFLLLDLTPLFVSHVEPLLNFPFWPIAGPSFAFFLPLWYLYVVYSTYLLFKKYQTSAGIRRLQLKYVFLGMVFAFAGGSTNYFLWYRVPIPPIFNILVSAFVAAIAYAILRYRLMDIRVVARRAVVVVGAGLVIYAAFRGAVWAELTSVGGLDSAKAVLGGVALALLFVPFFQWMIQMIERTANRTFFLALYNYQEAISKVSGQLTFHTDLAEITRLIVETIRKAMGVNTVSVQLAEDEAKIDAKDSLMAYLERTQRPVVREELDLLLGDDRLTGEEARFQAVHERMKIIGAAACLPLISNGRLIGMVALSPKAIGDPFTQEDMELLTVLANQASIAIDNARLVRKVKDFNKTLRQKVRKQTEGLRRQAEHLEKLLKMRSEFLDIASHQLKTPVSVIYGTVSMLQEGTIQKLPPEQQASFYQGIMVKAKKPDRDHPRYSERLGLRHESAAIEYGPGEGSGFGWTARPSLFRIPATGNRKKADSFLYQGERFHCSRSRE